MAPIKPAAVGTRLLATLPRKDRQRFLAGCEQVELIFSEVLANTGQRIRHVRFPTKGFVSLTTPIIGAASLEAGLIGDEGMLGISVNLVVDISPLHALVHGGTPRRRHQRRHFAAEPQTDHLSSRGYDDSRPRQPGSRFLRVLRGRCGVLRPDHGVVR